MERVNHIARAYCAVLLAVTIALWMQIVGYNANVLVSGALTAWLFSFTLEKLDRGAWNGFVRTVLKSRLATYSLVTALVTAGMVTMRLNGEWSTVLGMPPTCLMVFGGTLHIHHWAKALAVIAWQGDLYAILNLDDAPARDRLIRRYGKRTICLGTTLIGACSALVILDPKNRSMQFDTALHGLYFIGLGAVCLSGSTTDKWFRMAVAACLGIAVGIQLHGDVHIIGEIFSKNGLPPSFIFWHANGDPTCLVR